MNRITIPGIEKIRPAAESPEVVVGGISDDELKEIVMFYRRGERVEIGEDQLEALGAIQAQCQERVRAAGNHQLIGVEEFDWAAIDPDPIGVYGPVEDHVTLVFVSKEGRKLVEKGKATLKEVSGRADTRDRWGTLHNHYATASSLISIEERVQRIRTNQ